MSSSHETAMLARGCFWGMQDLLRATRVSSRRSACGADGAMLA